MGSNLEDSFVTISRKIDDEFVPVYYFNGNQFDIANRIYNRMRRLYESLPEFGPGYFTQNYSLQRRYFDDGLKTLDKLPEV